MKGRLVVRFEVSPGCAGTIAGDTFSFTICQLFAKALILTLVFEISVLRNCSNDNVLQV